MKLIKPKFWDKNYLTFQSLLLYPLTFIIDLRNLVTFFEKPKKYTQRKTICIGNIYLGGTGNTPLVSFLAKKLKNKFKKKIIKKKYQSHLDEKKLLENYNKVLYDNLFDNITYIDMKSIIILGQAWPQTRTPPHTHQLRWFYINYRNINEDKLDYTNNY